MSTIQLQKTYLRHCLIQQNQSLVKLSEAKDLKTDFKLGIHHEAHNDTLHETSLNLTVEVKQEDSVLATLEIQQAGIFSIEGYKPEQQDAITKGYCPNLLFPYLRQEAITLSQKAGLSTIELPLMDFNAIYQQQKQQAQQRLEEQELHQGEEELAAA